MPDLLAKQQTKGKYQMAALKQNQLLPAKLAVETADYKRRCWQWKIDGNKFKYEALLNPESYKIVGDRLSEGDEITCIDTFGSYDVTFRVVASDRNYCLVRPIRTWFANSVDVQDNEAKEAKVSFVPGRGFLVLSETGEPISNHLVQHEAEAALQVYLAEKAA
jgi:hypothetical protein